MPAVEPVFGWPVPEDADPIKDGAAAMRALAAAIAADLDELLAGSGMMLQVGISPAFGPNNASSATQAITFPKPFGAGQVYVLPPNLNSGSGATANWHVRGISITTEGFSAFAQGPGPVTFTATVTYLAIGPRP